MLIREAINYDHLEDRYVHVRRFANEPYLRNVQMLRDAGVDGFSESKLAGRVPMHIIEEWAKEAGITWDDPAMSDVTRRKLLSGDFDKLRVWEGTF